ncbi:guanylate kinase [Tothia fuscella]|uniref:Guanylate kinase n=1 Tax=Tothia fuscella TaxID=1048955 RepID=A0A9P4NKP6_9PEZI|nr:guanylate kinase [Tothia fuscella]
MLRAHQKVITLPKYIISIPIPRVLSQSQSQPPTFLLPQVGGRNRYLSLPQRGPRTQTRNFHTFSITMAPPPPQTSSQKGGNAPIVISGPSGSGKSTMVKRLLKQYPDRFALSVSHTTRKPRDGEVDGEHYNFVTKEVFKAEVEKGNFIEHAQFGSNLYGTTFAAVSTIQSTGKTCILDIEMEGVKQMHKSHLKARYLFIEPPSVEVLEKRLRGRGTDSEDAVKERLSQAVKELEYAKVKGVHDRVVVNDELEKWWDGWLGVDGFG